MAKKKKSGNTMLRMSPDVHARVDRAASALGMSMNGLLNLMVRTSLPLYEMQADMIQDPKTIKILREWSRCNPTQGLDRFFVDYFRLVAGQQIWFEDEHLYILEGEELRRVRSVPPPVPDHTSPETGTPDTYGSEEVGDIPF